MKVVTYTKVEIFLGGVKLFEGNPVIEVTVEQLPVLHAVLGVDPRQHTLDLLRRIRNRVSKNCCLWCTWVELGSDPAAHRHLKAACDDLGEPRTSKEARAMIHQAMRRCLAAGETG